MTAGYTCTRKTTEFASDDEIFFKMPDFDAVSMVFYRFLSIGFR